MVLPFVRQYRDETRSQTSLREPLGRSVPGSGGAPVPCVAPAPFIAPVAICVALCLAGGCRSTPKPWIDNLDLTSPERLDRGYTLLLPGIMGCNANDHKLTVGFAGADVPSAIEMYDWTEGPWLMLYNLRALKRNRREARKIAQKIMAYQDAYPGRPVHIVGYSGGAGMAVMALEALPPGRNVTGAVLLAATLAPSYDLRPAIGHTDRGIRSFHSPMDLTILTGVMTVVGTMDGRHTVAAGAWGFTPPAGLSDEERRRYRQGLIQQPYELKMFASGNRGGHFGWVHPDFVRQWLAPLVHPPPAEGIQTASYRQDLVDQLQRDTSETGVAAPGAARRTFASRPGPAGSFGPP